MIRHAQIYDGSGSAPFSGDIAIDADRLSYEGPPAPALRGRRIIEAHGRAAAPGFIDMMGHSEESLLIDGRAVSGLKQGVTLDIFTEQSFGPLNVLMAQHMAEREDHSTYKAPLQYATGAATGRVLRGRAWTGAGGGGCRNSSHDWTWVDQAS